MPLQVPTDFSVAHHLVQGVCAADMLPKITLNIHVTLYFLMVVSDFFCKVCDFMSNCSQVCLAQAGCNGL